MEPGGSTFFRCVEPPPSSTQPRSPRPRLALSEIRDAISSQLLRYRDGRGNDWADIIDMLTMYPEERRRVVRILGELEASPSA